MPWRVVAGTPCARALERVRADLLTPYPHWQRAPLSGRSGDRHTPRPSCRARPRGAHRAQSAPCPGGWCDRDPWTAPSSPGDFSQTGPGPHAAPRRGGCLLSARRTAFPGRARLPSGEPGLSSALRLRADCGENKARCPRAGNSARRLGRPRLCPGCWLTSRPRCRKRVSPAAASGGLRPSPRPPRRGPQALSCLRAPPSPLSPHKRLSAERPQPETGPRPERRCCGAAFPWAHARPL